MDVNVSPLRMELSGPEGPVFQGSSVQLVCDVFGARPAATVKWFNGSNFINDTDLVHTDPEQQRDGTFTTKSTLEFIATRWENGRHFKCYGENEVMKVKQQTALDDLKILDVRFPPVIKVGTVQSIVNEGDPHVMLSCTYYANPQKLLDATWVKDGKELVKISGKHENGNIESPSLHIKNISREDMGVYTCRLKNEVGEEESAESIFLDVHYAPDVEVIMEPSTPVKAVDRGNVTLECNVTSGNPPSLRKVRWFLGGELMTELPECNYTQPAGNETSGGPFCGIDPSILSLIRVEESFAGNYTCQGENEAGYGPESAPQELVVFYPPSPAKLRYYPSRVVKGASVTLECTVDHPGRPDNVTYEWFTTRTGSYKVHNITGSTWNITKASLQTRSNFTCIALNEGGQSVPATIGVNVMAPPDFSGHLDNYKGVLYTTNNFSLTCRIECFPRCSIDWYKDGTYLDTNNNKLYYVNNTEYPADDNKNIFESTESTLIWNMTNWPNKQLNKSADPSHYTCASRSTHDIGRAQINFTTEVAVDFPPEDIRLSTVMVSVVENHPPDPVKCGGKGRPKLSYAWITNETTHQPIATKDTLHLPKLTRNTAGTYLCEAYNKYGNITARVYFNVLYKPECSIEMTEKDGGPALICTARANPQEVGFGWKIAESNDTVNTENIINDSAASYLILDSSVDTARTYQCIANNSVGSSEACARYVPGTIPWHKRLGPNNLIIIIASIIVLILCVIVVCIIIIILCRKKRQNTKCNNPMEMEEREKFRRLKELLGFSSHGVPRGITESASGVVTYKKIVSTTPTADSVNPRKRKKPGYAPNPSSTGDKMRLGAAPPVGGSADPSSNDPDKGFYENLPFHGMQNPPNKPISVIAPFLQGNSLTQNFAPPSTFTHHPKSKAVRPVQRHQSFHGFQNNFPIFHVKTRLMGSQQIRPSLSNWPSWKDAQKVPNPFAFRPSKPTQAQPLLNFNPFLVPNPFSIPPQTRPRVIGRRECDIRRTASGINLEVKSEIIKKTDNEEVVTLEDESRRFGSLELRKHKCYSPTFYSVRCKKHAKKRPVIYALPKKIFGEIRSDGKSKTEVPVHPVPAPRCKKHQSFSSFENDRNENAENVSNASSDNVEAEISVIRAQVHNTSKEIEKTTTPKLTGVSLKAPALVKAETLKAMKNSPTLKVSPNFVKPKTESPKGALSLKIQAKRMNSGASDDNSKEDLPLIPQMPLLEPKWSPSSTNNANQQNAFYTLTTPHYKHVNVGLPPQYSATIPHQKHHNSKLAPKALFNEQLPKSKSFSSKSKHKKHFQIPIQKCNSFKFQTAESYFQPIKNIHEEDLMRNGYVSDYPDGGGRSRPHKRDKLPKQKTKGPLVLRRPGDYHEQFQENMHNSVQLQYPQPLIGRNPPRPNGVVYADLDMPKASPNSKKGPHETSSSQTKPPKSKPKTEYATLAFNDVGQEIDV